MLNLDNSITISIILYLFFICLILYIKPKIIFTNNSRIKRFGTGKNKTIFPFWLVTIIIAIFSQFFINYFYIIGRKYIK